MIIFKRFFFFFGECLYLPLKFIILLINYWKYFFIGWNLLRATTDPWLFSNYLIEPTLKGFLEYYFSLFLHKFNSQIYNWLLPIYWFFNNYQLNPDILLEDNKVLNNLNYDFFYKYNLIGEDKSWVLNEFLYYNYSFYTYFYGYLNEYNMWLYFDPIFFLRSYEKSFMDSIVNFLGFFDFFKGLNKNELYYSLSQKGYIPERNLNIKNNQINNWILPDIMLQQTYIDFKKFNDWIYFNIFK